MSKLLGQYVKTLDALIKKEVAADRIEEAKVIKKEREKIAFLLADLQTKAPMKAMAEAEPKPVLDKKAETVAPPSTRSTGPLLAGSSAKIDLDKTTFLEAVDYSSAKSKDDHAWKKIKNLRKGTPEHLLASPSNNKVYDIDATDFEKRSPVVVYQAWFPKEGSYYLWINGQGEAGGAAVAVGFDGALIKSQIVGFFPYSFSWLGAYQGGDRIELDVLKSGIHTVEIYMVEDGMRVARLAITSDPEYNPKR